MTKETWIIAANGTSARIFRLEKALALLEIHSLIHPEGKMHPRDLVSDKQGTSFESMSTARSSMEPHTTIKKAQAQAFARMVAEFIDKARGKGEVERLFIAASPTILGMLRHFLSDSTLKILEAEVSKDITHLDPNEIRGYFPIGL
ncbi:MAG: host attachment protein [Waddliaceae bacterium]